MLVKLNLVNGNTEIFETDKFVCAKKSEMNPDILKVEIYNNGIRVCKIERFFKSFYKKYVYKPAEQKEEEKKA